MQATNQSYQLYATLYEWHMGEQHISEFPANSYLNVYKGHVNTLEFGRNVAMHSIPWWQTSLLGWGEFIVLVLFHDWLICDGSAAANIEIPAGVPVADLNIDELKKWAQHMASTANTSN